MELNNIQGEKMELYHKITKEVLELLLKEGAQMPVDLGRKLKRSSSNMQQVREYLSSIGCIHVTKKRNFYELKITEKGTILLDVMRQMEKLDKPGNPIPKKQDVDLEVKGMIEEKAREEEAEAKAEPPEIKVPEEPKPDKRIKTSHEEISRGGRKGILTRLG